MASVVVDVGPDRDEDEMFRALRATTRRRVRQARKQGVTVRSGTVDDLPTLHAIIEATARRQGFAPYPADYYRRLWTVFGPSGHARLLIAEHQGVPLSAALLIAFGDTVLYKIGGWRDVEGSPPGVNVLMHWTGISWAHSAGYLHYDFEGIPLAVAQEVDHSYGTRHTRRRKYGRVRQRDQGPLMTPTRLATALRAHAQGLYCLEAAAELLIAQSWFRRTDFTSRFITATPSLVDGQPMAIVDWPSAITALNTGNLPGSGGEQRMLRMTASIADGIPVDLRDSLTGIDDHNIQLLLRAVLHTSGQRQSQKPP